MSHSVLMVAYHFPPFQGSSGIQRTVRFMQYLPHFGWNPLILAPHQRVYPRCAPESLAEVPSTVPVERAFALNIARYAAFGGAFPRWLALPDRYNTWLLGAVPAGLRLIRKHRPKAIWTTYPVATAHLIGYALHKLTGLPWVADFRDPMLYEAWPEEALQRRAYGWLERLTAENATKIACVTPSAVRLYQERYGEKTAKKIVLIPNGYDEASFAGIVRFPGRQNGPRKLLHSGLLEPADRDPAAFFEALRRLKTNGVASRQSLQVMLRGSGSEERYRAQIDAFGLTDIISLEPAVAYRKALQEMVDADGLLLFQGPTCNRQIPAKAYEYIRAGTPILSICDPRGDTANLLSQVPQCFPADFGDVQRIAAVLGAFLNDLDAGTSQDAVSKVACRYDRRTLTGNLAALLDEIAAL